MALIDDQKELHAIYGDASGRASIKVLGSLEKHSKNFIQLSPFLVISTVDKDGNVDTSPRGGRPGFVTILDDHHILIPDSKGNNRVDSLSNIVDSGRIGTLFFLPGVNETLRINGSAEISDDPAYLDLFSSESQQPKTVIKIKVEEMFLHCAKALMRSKLWELDSQINRKDFPTMGRMLNEQLNTNNPEETQDEMEARYKKDL